MPTLYIGLVLFRSVSHHYLPSFSPYSLIPYLFFNSSTFWTYSFCASSGERSLSATFFQALYFALACFHSNFAVSLLIWVGNSTSKGKGTGRRSVCIKQCGQLYILLRLPLARTLLALVLRKMAGLGCLA